MTDDEVIELLKLYLRFEEKSNWGKDTSHGGLACAIEASVIYSQLREWYLEGK